MTEVLGGIPQPGQGSGSGLPTSGAKGDLLVYTGTAWTQLPRGTDGFALTADSTQLTGLKYIAAVGLGTVTSVGLSLPGEFSVSGSPVIAAGVLTAGWGSQAANKIFASPDNASGTPTFRAMVLRDVPNGGTSGQALLAGASIPAYGALNLAGASIVTGALPLANLTDGGTAGIPLLAGGGGGDPNYAALNLAQATAITGALPLVNLTDGGTAGVPLVAGGGGGDPSYTALALGQATAVSGQLPVANGGTGKATLAANNALLGNGTSPVQEVAPSTAGNVLRSDGTTWGSWTPIKEIEVDFGATPTAYKTFTITDATVAATSKIIAVQSGAAPTGKSADENEMDPIVCSCNPAAGAFTLNAAAQDGPVVGKFKFNYMLVA